MARARKGKNKLNDMQSRFCKEYIKDLNATQAAIRAGYKEKAAKAQGSKLLTNDDISCRVQSLMDKRSKKVEVEADTILRELLKLATSDLRQMFHEDGRLLEPHEWPDSVAGAISSIEVFEEFEWEGGKKKKIGQTKKIRLWDKTKGLQLLGKHLQLFNDTIKLDVSKKLEDIIAGSWKE